MLFVCGAFAASYWNLMHFRKHIQGILQKRKKEQVIQSPSEQLRSEAHSRGDGIF